MASASSTAPGRPLSSCWRLSFACITPKSARTTPGTDACRANRKTSSMKPVRRANGLVGYTFQCIYSSILQVGAPSPVLGQLVAPLLQVTSSPPSFSSVASLDFPSKICWGNGVRHGGCPLRALHPRCRRGDGCRRRAESDMRKHCMSRVESSCKPLRTRPPSTYGRGAKVSAT